MEIALLPHKPSLVTTAVEDALTPSDPTLSCQAVTETESMAQEVVLDHDAQTQANDHFYPE